MQTPKNGFQILNLHPKKLVYKKIPFFMYFCLSNTKNLYERRAYESVDDESKF